MNKASKRYWTSQIKRVSRQRRCNENQLKGGSVKRSLCSKICTRRPQEKPFEWGFTSSLPLQIQTCLYRESSSRISISYVDAPTACCIAENEKYVELLSCQVCKYRTSKKGSIAWLQSKSIIKAIWSYWTGLCWSIESVKLRQREEGVDINFYLYHV